MPTREPDLRSFLNELDDAASPAPKPSRRTPRKPVREQPPVEVPPPPLPMFQRQPEPAQFPTTRPSPYAEPFARVFVAVVLPVVGAVLVAVAARVVCELYELLCFGLALVFLRWAIARRPATDGVQTWGQAGRLAVRATLEALSVPAAGFSSFLVAYWLFGVFWAYVTALTLSLVSFGVTEGRRQRAAAARPSVERGRSEGGIDDKARAEYEKALHDLKRHG
ncbi:hypothetical protein J0H58_16675 [bacterium]|nr:hypothetical protein [bacterium]